MLNVDDYVTGHEDDVEEFDLNSFLEELHEWQDEIKDELKQNTYNMTCLCVREVLNKIEEMIWDNTMTIYGEKHLSDIDKEIEDFNNNKDNQK